MTSEREKLNPNLIRDPDSNGRDKANCEQLTEQLQKLGLYLDQFLQFKHSDAMSHVSHWRTVTADVTVDSWPVHRSANWSIQNIAEY